MAIAKKHSSSDDDFRKVGPDATATFDNSSRNPTGYTSNENLDAIDTDENELDVEDIDEEEDDEYDDEEEEYDEDDDEEDNDEEDDEDDDHDLATGPKAPSVYRKL